MHDKSLTLERFFSQSRADRSSFETFLNIEAWSVMLPLMKEGASMRFFMPSQYCFATQRVYNVAELDAGSIPSNAVLVFDIRLHTVGE